MYIKTAEENQIRKFNDVDELVLYFKKILPYAVALGVKNEAINLMKKAIKLYNLDENMYYDSMTSSRIYFNTYNDYRFSNYISSEYNKAYDRLMEKSFSTLTSSGSRCGRSGGGGLSGGA